MTAPDYDCIVVGGGLGGLVAALRLAQHGRRVALIEKRSYPFHKVCGEYISNEVRPFLESLGFFPQLHGAASINKLEVTDHGGRALQALLPLGGFGLSRYVMDEALFQRLVAAGGTGITGTKVVQVTPQDDHYRVDLSDGRSLTTGLVIGAWGKRESMDKQLNRAFMQVRTGFVGVKYHIRCDHPPDVVALHNFEGGYCGLSQIEEGRYNLCYLTTRELLRTHGSVPVLEQAVLHQNPHLNRIFHEADFLWEKPEVINEFSFAPKTAVEQGIWMVGDAAGLITPLCGNGMAMAIHGAKLLTDVLLNTPYFKGTNLPPSGQRAALEQHYARTWRQHFGRRLWVGRAVQRHAFGRKNTAALAVGLLRRAPGVTQWLIRQTHGRPF
jgi:menaquinone-9 beta-reductase